MDLSPVESVSTGSVFDDADESLLFVRVAVEYEMHRMRQELRHLIYPLNYSSKTTGLIPRQERFFQLYDASFVQWREETISRGIGYGGSVDAVNYNINTAREHFQQKCSREGRVQMLKTLLLRWMERTGYDSRTRTLLGRLARVMRIDDAELAVSVEQTLLHELHELHDTRTDDTQLSHTPASGATRWSRRRWMYATCGVALGAAACSLTAGLAAPIFIPAVLSAAGITGAAFLASGGGVALMATLFGLAGAGMAGYRVSRRLADLADFRFIPLKDAARNRSLRVFVGVSGWIRSEDDFTAPWIQHYLSTESDAPAIRGEAYCVSFDRQVLLSLGRGLQDFLTSSAVTIAASEAVKLAMSAAATTALFLPVAVLQAGDLVDNPWTLGMDRARKAGRVLAEALRQRAAGRRPVTLVGYSLGALVIFTCLQELARSVLDAADVTDESGIGIESRSDLSVSPPSPERPAHTNDGSLFGIVENVVLMGLPAHLPAPSVWNQLRLLVAGRFVHCYSRRDWILRFLYRSTALTSADIAGINPLPDAPTIESVDLSNLVTGHLDYQARLPEIMQLVQL